MVVRPADLQADEVAEGRERRALRLTIKGNTLPLMWTVHLLGNLSRKARSKTQSKNSLTEIPKSRKLKDRASPTKTTECRTETNKTSHPLAIKDQKKEKAAVTVVKAEAPRQGRMKKKKMRNMSKESRNNNRFLRTKRPRKVKFPISIR